MQASAVGNIPIFFNNMTVVTEQAKFDKHPSVFSFAFCDLHRYHSSVSINYDYNLKHTSMRSTTLHLTTAR